MTDVSFVPAATFDLVPWDDRLPFPLSGQECAALCRGHAVRWSTDVATAMELPFRCEVIDGWLMLKRH